MGRFAGVVDRRQARQTLARWAGVPSSTSYCGALGSCSALDSLPAIPPSRSIRRLEPALRSARRRSSRTARRLFRQRNWRGKLLSIALCWLLLGVAVYLTGCATHSPTTGSGETRRSEGGVQTACLAFQPFRWSQRDTRETQEQAIRHNAVGVSLCHWQAGHPASNEPAAATDGSGSSTQPGRRAGSGVQ